MLTCSYDAAGRETALQYRKAEGTALAVFTSTYNRIGLRTKLAELDGSITSYSYDAGDMLVREQRTGSNPSDINYPAYDAAGNRNNWTDGTDRTTYTYDAANQLSTAVTGAAR